MTTDARNKFQKLEDRVQRFFEPNISKLMASARNSKFCIEKHKKLRLNLRQKNGKELKSLAERELEFEAKYDRLLFQDKQWRENRRKYWALQKTEKQEQSQNMLQPVTAAFRIRRSTLEAMQKELEKVNHEIASMWWSDIFGLSQAKKDATERKRQIETLLHNEKSMIQALERKLRGGERTLQKELDGVDRSADCELEDREKWLHDERGIIRAEIRHIRSEMVDCTERFYRLMVGIEKKFLQSIVDGVETEVSSLLETENESSGIFDANGEFDIDCLRKEAMRCEAEVDAKAEEIMAQSGEKIESLKLGRRHSLHRLAHARQLLQIKLESKAVVPSQLQKELETLFQGLERVLILEENRLLGFPRRGIRQGPMPVYYKRSLLRERMSKARALIITAGTGCGG